jgi:hypothetical protein
MPIRSIADIPFRERDAFALLNLTPGAHADAEHEGPDLDYAGFGYARVGELWLATHEDPEPRPVRNVLLLALHTPDDADVHDNELLLEFWPEGDAPDDDGDADDGDADDDDADGDDADDDGEADDDEVVQVMLSRFLEIWLPRISSDERAIVLAVCNPQHTRLTRAPALRGAPIHYPLGDTTSWCEEPADFLAGPGALQLLADAWLTA